VVVFKRRVPGDIRMKERTGVTGEDRYRKASQTMGKKTKEKKKEKNLTSGTG